LSLTRATFLAIWLIGSLFTGSLSAQGARASSSALRPCDVNLADANEPIIAAIRLAADQVERRLAQANRETLSFLSLTLHANAQASNRVRADRYLEYVKSVPQVQEAQVILDVSWDQVEPLIHNLAAAHLSHEAEATEAKRWFAELLRSPLETYMMAAFLLRLKSNKRSAGLSGASPQVYMAQVARARRYIPVDVTWDVLVRNSYSFLASFANEVVLQNRQLAFTDDRLAEVNEMYRRLDTGGQLNADDLNRLDDYMKPMVEWMVETYIYFRRNQELPDSFREAPENWQRMLLQMAKVMEKKIEAKPAAFVSSLRILTKTLVGVATLLPGFAAPSSALEYQRLASKFDGLPIPIDRVHTASGTLLSLVFVGGFDLPAPGEFLRNWASVNRDVWEPLLKEWGAETGYARAFAEEMPPSAIDSDPEFADEVLPEPRTPSQQDGVQDDLQQFVLAADGAELQPNTPYKVRFQREYAGVLGEQTFVFSPSVVEQLRNSRRICGQPAQNWLRAIRLGMARIEGQSGIKLLKHHSDGFEVKIMLSTYRLVGRRGADQIWNVERLEVWH